MTPHPRRSAPEVLHLHGSHNDPERTAEDQQAAGAQCTCTGGPYLHGPEGLRKELQKVAAEPQPAQSPKGDTTHE